MEILLIGSLGLMAIMAITPLHDEAKLERRAAIWAVCGLVALAAILAT